MLKTLLNPLKTGAGKTGSKRSLRLLFVTLCLLFISDPGRAAATPPVHQLLVHFDLENASLRATSRVEFAANTGDLYHMPGMTIESLKINGREIDLSDRSQIYFSDPDHEIKIPPAPTPTKVTLTYSLALTGRDSPVGDIIGPGGISLTGIWHPFLHQDSYFKLSVELPTGFEAISEADSIETIPLDNGNKRLAFSFNHPLAGINLIAGPFKVESVPFGEGKKLYSYFFEEDQELAAEYRRKALNYLALYEEMIGPYPYNRFSIVENRLPTGYAMPTFTVLGQRVVRLPFITETSLGHEILHQWFGNAVRPPLQGGNWTEGLTTYLADQLYAERKGKGETFRKNQLSRYQAYAGTDNQLTLAEFSGAASHLVAGQGRNRAVGYDRASMVFHMLRLKLGDELFFSGLKDVYHRLRHQRAGWADLIASFEQVSNRKIGDFINPWLNRPETPLLSVKNLQAPEEDGRPVLRFTLSQSSGAAPLSLQVPVRIRTADGVVSRLVELNALEKKVEIPLASRPRELIIDENYDLLRRLTPTEWPPVWYRFEGADNKIAIIDQTPGQAAIYQPLIDYLSGLDCRILSADEVSEEDISKNSVIFLGSSSGASRAIFADPGHPGEGMTIELRENPLNPGAVAVLVTAENRAEVEKAAHKIRHYGKYSYLHFKMGRVTQKEIAEADQGRRYLIDPAPSGVELRRNLDFETITDSLNDRQVVYIGESHTRYEDHLLQLRIIRAMYRQNPDLAIGMEMFNRPVQPILDQYILEQSINEEEFLRRSHFISKWGYDYRYYQPIINFARRNHLPVIALNIKKKIVSAVYKGSGIGGLEPEDREVIPPERDLSMPGYRRRIGRIFTMHTPQTINAGQLNQFLQAQALWDETMAESISRYLSDNPGRRMAVIAGKGHVGKDTGIPPRVARRLDVRQSVILNVGEMGVDQRVADYLIFSKARQLPRKAVMGVMLKETPAGVVVDKLSPHGQAGASGVKAKDLILALDGRPVKNIEELKIILFFKKPGDLVKVSLLRNRFILPDQRLEIEVPL